MNDHGSYKKTRQSPQVAEVPTTSHLARTMEQTPIIHSYNVVQQSSRDTGSLGMSIHPPDLFGCQSLWMGSLSRADETILSWSLVGRPIPAPYQYSGNDGHSFSTEENHKTHSHSFVMISDNTTVVSYISKHGGTHSPNLCIDVWEILHRCLEHDIVITVRHIPGRLNILADCLSRLDRPLKTELALDQSVAKAIFQMLNYPNVDLFETRLNHKL